MPRRGFCSSFKSPCNKEDRCIWKEVSKSKTRNIKRVSLLFILCPFALCVYASSEGPLHADVANLDALGSFNKTHFELSQS